MVAARLGFEKAMVGTSLDPRPFWPRKKAGPEGSGVQTRLVPGGPPHALTAWTGLENTTLTLQRAGFLQERLLGL